MIIIKNMETSVKTGFAQIFSCCPKNLSCPNFGGAAAPLAPRPVRLCHSVLLPLFLKTKQEIQLTFQLIILSAWEYYYVILQFI